MLKSLVRSIGSRRWIPLQKQEIKRIGGGSPLPIRCLSQFLLREEKINCLGSEFSAYLSPTEWHGIYSGGFSQLDGDKDILLLDEGFSFLIIVRLIRDN